MTREPFISTDNDSTGYRWIIVMTLRSTMYSRGRKAHHIKVQDGGMIDKNFKDER